jgi:hypothetical protein
LQVIGHAGLPAPLLGIAFVLIGNSQRRCGHVTSQLLESIEQCATGQLGLPRIMCMYALVLWSWTPPGRPYVLMSWLRSCKYLELLAELRRAEGSKHLDYEACKDVPNSSKSSRSINPITPHLILVRRGQRALGL